VSRRLNIPIPDALTLEAMAGAKRTARMSGCQSTYQLLRETFFDTPEGTLRENQITLRLRAEARGRQVLELRVLDAVNLQGVVEETILETPVVSGGLYGTLAGTSEVATRVREFTELDALRPQVALDIDRETRDLKARFWRRPQHRISFDQIVAHVPGATRAFQEITLIEMGAGATTLETLGSRLRSDFSVDNDGLDTFERVRQALSTSPKAPKAEVPQEVLVTPLLLLDGKVALIEARMGLTLPRTRGSGEDLAREYISELLEHEGAELELDLVGFAPMSQGGGDLEVWLHQLPSMVEPPSGLVWIPLDELMERIGGPRLREPGLVATLLLLVRSEIGLKLLRDAPVRLGVPTELPLEARDGGTKPGKGDDDYLDLELSILEFNQRVLEMAEDDSLPLLERFLFLSIFSANMDEFFVVRVGRIKDAAAEGQKGEEEDFTAQQLLDLIAVRVRALMSRQYACLTQVLLPRLAEHGIGVVRWEALEADQKKALSEHFTKEIFPLLTPLSMSTSAGRSFPRLPSLGLSLAAVLRRSGEAKTGFGYVPVPSSLPRILAVPGSKDVVVTNEVIMANASELFPSYDVQGVHTFRVSRWSEVNLNEDPASLLSAVADEVEERRFKPVIRIEVQDSMPREVRAHLLRELRAERGIDAAVLSRNDLYEVSGPIDLTGLSEFASLDVPDGRFESFEPSNPLSEDESIFDVLQKRDPLIHHPFEAFDNTVGRFLSEAAVDEQVMAIKLTLYRTGKDSPIMEALLKALHSGKDVSVFVEVTARFDEESNIEWTRRLTEAGAHVVYGVVGYKTHAKTALVVRKEEDGVRRYVHIGTGNYNAATARFYTDLGLMSCDPDLGADLHDFFNEITGSDGPPQKQFRRLLIAPNSLVHGIDRMIAREIDHANAGRPARIQVKLNGLADRKIVKKLYKASRAGVQVDLIVRSICTLRPGVPGLSENVQVRSILGRFLEHSRIIYFENAGQSEYYIGSADWRARNLRRRVEVITPVDDPAARKVLRAILEAQLADPTAWVLRADGVFERLQGDGPTSQEVFMADAGQFADAR